MLPSSDDYPPASYEGGVVSPVPQDVAFKLASPPLGVALGGMAVDFTPVPPAPVDEYGHAFSGEDHVGLAPKPFKRADVLSETKAAPV